MAIATSFERLLVAVLLSLLASLCCAQDARSLPEKRDAESGSPAQADDKSSSPNKDGALLYKQYCQACHMADGKGATGAAAYPALANNPKLQAASYPVIIVLYGKAGMPWFNGLLAPEQIAAIVGHVRTHFGNNYGEPVTTDEVAKMRGPVPKDE